MASKPSLFPQGYRINHFRTAVPITPVAQPIKRPSLKPTISIASRKRSCAEMSSDDESSPASIASGQSPDSLIQHASTSEVWAKELAERLRSSSMGESRAKAMRFDSETGVPPIDDPDAMESDAHPAPASMANTIDEASVALGIGWSTVPSTPVMMDAARGWARFIENNYALQAVRVLWQCKEPAAYLVCGASREGVGRPGSPGYYLFDETLSEGRLIAKSWERVMDNLRSQPMVFDGGCVFGVVQVADRNVVESEVQLDTEMQLD